MLEGILKDRTYQRGLDSEHDFVSSWKQDDLSIGWPFVVSLASSSGWRGAGLM